VIDLRIGKEAGRAFGVVSNIPVTKDLLCAFKHANSEYLMPGEGKRGQNCWKRRIEDRGVSQKNRRNKEKGSVEKLLKEEDKSWRKPS
jgi:hypothetical protein